MSRLLAVALCLSLAACGLKGPLTPPAGAVPEPLLGNSKASVPAKRSGDVSTDHQTTRP